MGLAVGRTDRASPRGTARPGTASSRACPGLAAHHAFLLTWTWQRRFKACPRDTRKKGAPRGTPGGAPQPRPQEPAAGSRRGRARGALTLSPERRQQRQQQEQPQRPGPAEVVHRRGALAPSGSRLSCGVRWAPPSRWLLPLLSQPPETGWERACRNPPLGGLHKDLIQRLPA